jgi:uncharacterized membrane protein
MGERTMCWNCRTAPARADAAHRVRLSRDVRTRFVVVGHQYRWSSREVVVPRCARCRRTNVAYAVYGRVLRAGGGFVGFMAFCGALAALTVHRYGALVVAAFMAAALLAVLVPARLYMWRHPRRAPAEYPAVAALIADGWRIGNPY